MPPETRPHGAQFSDAALAVITDAIKRYPTRLRDTPLRVLDPFAGVGGIFRLTETIPDLDVVGVELEPEWAHAHRETLVGDATHLDGFPDESFDLVITSPAFGNRLADSYDGHGQCRRCAGAGTVNSELCVRCGGAGVDQSKRHTYRIWLGRPLHDANGASYQWGEVYRDIHRRAWREAYRLLRDGGFLMVDVKDHRRSFQWQAVPEWHLGAAVKIGFTFAEDVTYVADGIRHGTNHEARDDVAHLLILSKGD
jgi:SAM-dependent methyltransferase